MNVATETSFATLISMVLVKKLHLDNIYYGAIYSIIMGLFGSIGAQMMHINVSYDVIYYLVGFIIIIPLVYLVFRYTYTEYAIVNIYNPSQIKLFMKYIKLHSTFYDGISNIDVGDIDILRKSDFGNNRWTMSDDELTLGRKKKVGEYSKMPFNDINYHTKGYIECIRSEHSSTVKTKNGTEEKKIVDKFLRISIKKEKHLNVRNYVNNVFHEVRKANQSRVILSYKKYVPGPERITSVCVTFYNEPRKSFDELENLYMGSFFHAEKEKIWGNIKNIHLNPDRFIKVGQSPRTSLLLHGPPGSGKSSFASRVATITGRDVISVDVRDCKTKKELFYLFYSEEYYDGKMVPTYKKSVFVLEEFDLGIKELHRREEFHKKEKEMMDKYYRTYYDTFNTTEINKCKINKEKTVITPTTDEIFVRDLLELLQGPVNLKGMIIIATTNNFDYMQNICPELFRHGRMTPIYFGHADSIIIQQIAEYYFNKHLRIKIPDNIVLPTSQIIELALECQLNPKDGFNAFERQIRELLLTKKIDKPSASI
jgi:hypothetical protein